MTDNRAERLGLEPGATSAALDKAFKDEGCLHPAGANEVQHSIAISLGRIADALDDVVRANASIIVDVRQP